MQKLEQTILHGGLCHAGYWRLRTSTASLGTCTRVSLVDPCRWGESTTQGEIHRHFLDLLSYPLFSHLLVSSSTPSACHLHNLFFSSYVLTDLTSPSHHITSHLHLHHMFILSSDIFSHLLLSSIYLTSTSFPFSLSGHPSSSFFWILLKEGLRWFNVCLRWGMTGIGLVLRHLE